MKVRVEGLKELDSALADISRSAGKAALRRALKTSAEPLARLMRSLAPKGPDMYLSEGIDVSTKLSKRQASLNRKMFMNDRAAVEMFVGAGPDPAAHNQEFGNEIHGPKPFARPAWDQDKLALLKRLQVEMWDEIEVSVKRAERKAAKQALK